MKKTLTILLILASITITGSFAFATVTYILDKTVSQDVIVGSTVQYSQGLFIELAEYDTHTLTFFDIEETDTQKHYITYTYNYTVLVDNVDIEVSSITDDIVVSELVATESTIAITFSLNQVKEFNDGDVLNVQFYFEAVEQVGININTATIDQLLSIGFTESEATEIVALTYNVTTLDELYGYIYIADIHTRFDSLVNEGLIVFN